jgi:hypothetical protein
MDIILYTGGVNGEMSDGLVNIFRRHEACCTHENPGKLDVRGKVVAKDSTHQVEVWKGKYVNSNPENTTQNETKSNRDEVWETIRLAAHAERAMSTLPLFVGEDTERHIGNVGGGIIFEAPAGTWASTPDAPGKDKCNTKTEWLTVRIEVVPLQSNRDRELECTPNSSGTTSECSRPLRHPHRLTTNT